MTDEPRQTPAETVSHEAPGRQWIIDLVRDQFDPAPAHYKLGDNWDDGAPAIADAILAQLPLLVAERNPPIALVGAYLGLLVLRTMCRKAKLSLAEQRAAEIAADLDAAYPGLAARSALRSSAPEQLINSHRPESD